MMRLLSNNFLYSKYHPRLVAAFVISLAIGIALYLNDNKNMVVPFLEGWDIFVWLYLLMLWHFMYKADHEDVRKMTQRADPSAVLILCVFCLGSLFSIASIVYLLGSESSQQITHSLLALIAVTLIGAWLIIPTLFTMHYAHAFYRSPADNRSLIFPDKVERPNYLDVAYFSFTISLAAQTSDIGVGGRAMRMTVLIHAIISFLFNTTILGLSINLLSNVVR